MFTKFQNLKTNNKQKRLSNPTTIYFLTVQTNVVTLTLAVVLRTDATRFFRIGAFADTKIIPVIRRVNAMRTYNNRRRNAEKQTRSSSKHTSAAPGDIPDGCPGIRDVGSRSEYPIEARP